MLIFNRTSRSGFNLNFLLGILIAALFVALLLASNKYDQLWILSIPIVLIIVWKSNLWTLIFITLLVFIGDWLIDLEILPPQFMWGHELFILLLFIKAITNRLLKKTHIVFTGGWVLLAFLLVNIVSQYINKTGLVNMILFLRLVLIAYFLFLAIINLDLKEKELKIFTNLLLFLIIIQLPVAISKMFIYGQGERAIGTYGYHGGTLSTALPLVVIGFGLVFRLIYRKSLLFIGLVLGAISFAVIGGKRGFIFFLPLLMIFLSWYLKDNIRYLFRYTVLGAIIFFIALYLALSFIPTLSPERGFKSNLDPEYAISFATQYTTRESWGLSWGRTKTNVNVFNNLASRGILHFLFGTGPGAAMKSRFDTFDTRDKLKEEFNIGYGITGMTLIAMSVGYLGVFFVFLLLFIIMRKCSSYYKKAIDPFWRAYGLSMAAFSFIMIIINFAYAPIILDDLLASLYFCLSSFIVLKANRLGEEKKQELVLA